MLNTKIANYFFFLFLLLTANVQSMEPHEVESVVEIKNFEPTKHLLLLEQVIETTATNVKVIATCEQKGWVVFKIIEQKHSASEQISFLMKASGLEFIIKENATKKDVANACNDELKNYN